MAAVKVYGEQPFTPQNLEHLDHYGMDADARFDLVEASFARFRASGDVAPVLPDRHIVEVPRERRATPR